MEPIKKRGEEMTGVMIPRIFLHPGTELFAMSPRLQVVKKPSGKRKDPKGRRRRKEC